MRSLPTIQLSSFTSFTYIDSAVTETEIMHDWSQKWIYANITVYSKLTALKLNHFISAFKECLILYKKSPAKQIKLKINIKFTCAVAEYNVLFLSNNEIEKSCRNKEFDSAKELIYNILFFSIIIILMCF